MHFSFEDYEGLLHDQVSAIVEAELHIDPARAARCKQVLDSGRVAPQIIGCQPALPERDPSPAALMPMWLVCSVAARAGERAFIAYDPGRQRFGRGFWEGPTAWYVETAGSLLDLLEQLAEVAGDQAA
jgi:hypothetical protein